MGRGAFVDRAPLPFGGSVFVGYADCDREGTSGCSPMREHVANAAPLVVLVRVDYFAQRGRKRLARKRCLEPRASGERLDVPLLALARSEERRVGQEARVGRWHDS